MVTKSTVDPTNALKKLNRVNKQIIKLGKITADMLVESGKQYARTIVPVYTGKTYRLIKAFKATRSNPQATVVAENPTAHDGHHRRMANFNLVRWMHTSGKAFRHIHSGDPHFMYTTRQYLNNIKIRVAKGNWQKLNVKI